MRNISNDSFYFKILFNGTYFYTNEPVGWNQVTKTLKEDEDYYGLNYEYIDSKLTLNFTFQALNDGGFLLQDLWKEFGNDAKANFEFGEIRNGQVFPDFFGTFNFNDYEESEDGVSISIERVSFESLYRTRYDIKVALNANETLDGVPVTPLEPLLIQLHSKRIAKSAESSNVEPVSWTGEHLFAINAFLQLDSTNITSLELPGFMSLPAGFGPDPVPDDRYNFEAEEAGLFNLNFSGHIDLVKQNTNSGYTNLNIRVFPFVKVQRGGVLIIDNTLGFSFIYEKAFGGGAGGIIELDDINYNIDYSVDLEIGDRVYFGLRFVNLDGTPINPRYISIDGYTSNITINQLTVAEESKAFGYNWFEAMNRVIYLTTGINNALVSKFFDVGGCGYNYMVLNGFSIRGFLDSERPLFASARDLIEGMLPLWNAGILITEDEGPKVLIESFDDFYGDRKLMTIKEAGSLVLMTDKNYIFNETEITYQAFEDEQPNTLDQFATLRQYLLPIKTYKAKKPIKSSFIVSSYSIEYQRRAQFLTNPRESLERDDNIFLINYSEDRTYKDLKMKTVLSTKKLFTDRRVAMNFDGQFKLSDDPNFYSPVSESVTDELGYNWEYNLVSGIPDRIITNDGAQFVDLIVGWDPEVEGLQAVRDEEFTVVDNVVDRFTEYNLRLSPGRVLNNWASYLNIGLDKKLNSEMIRPTFAKNNRFMETTLARLANCIVNNKRTISEDANILLSDFGLNRSKPFQPVLIQFIARLPFSQQKELFTRLRKLNDVSGENPGYIEVLSKDNKVYLLYIGKMEYHIKTEEIKITGKLINSVN